MRREVLRMAGKRDRKAWALVTLLSHQTHHGTTWSRYLAGYAKISPWCLTLATKTVVHSSQWLYYQLRSAFLMSLAPQIFSLSIFILTRSLVICVHTEVWKTLAWVTCSWVLFVSYLNTNVIDVTSFGSTDWGLWLDYVVFWPGGAPSL